MNKKLCILSWITIILAWTTTALSSSLKIKIICIIINSLSMILKMKIELNHIDLLSELRGKYYDKRRNQI